MSNIVKLLEICVETTAPRNYLYLVYWSFMGDFKKLQDIRLFDELNNSELEQFIKICDNRMDRAKTFLRDIATVLGFIFAAFLIVLTLASKENKFPFIVPVLSIYLFIGSLGLILIGLFAVLAHYRSQVHAWTAFKEKAILMIQSEKETNAEMKAQLKNIREPEKQRERSNETEQIADAKENAEPPKKKPKYVIFITILIILIGLSYFSFKLLNNQIGPASVYETEPFTIIHEGIGDNGLAGSYFIDGMYRSTGIISANKKIEFYIFGVSFYFNKEYFRGTLGNAYVWRDNFTAEICPENAKAWDDPLFQKSPCINVMLKKSDDSGGVVEYFNQSKNLNEIEFYRSGSLNLRVQTQVMTIVKEGLFKIEPTYKNSELELIKYTLFFTVIGILISIISLLRKGKL